MLICQGNADLQAGTDSQDEDWTVGVQRYPNVEKMPPRHGESAGQHLITDPQHLQGK